ncbi:uncharacterized protein [Miscanthus floridulus]|uniref:uncharacterized protein isoform X2 n=1 Tax=Miscanthus floridulus TaxID=154761 RepID=UPI00345ADA73
MADLAVSLAKSVVEGAVTKALAAIEEEGALRQSTQNDLAFITGEFQMMQSFLNVADEERVRNSVVRTWVRQVRDLAYNVEDCIEYVIHLDKAPDWYCRCIPRFIRPQLPLDMAVAEIKLLKGRVEEVSLRNMRYNLISDSGSKPVTQQQLVPSGASVGATTFAMLNKARDTTKMQRGLGDLTKLLITKKPGGDLGVISVWAAGGNAADTTPIIREAYGEPEICGSFGCRGWAKLTHPFSPHEFQRSLLIQFHTKPCIQNETDEYVNILQRLEAASEGELVHDFMKIMKQERYLVVLENISSMVDWDTIRAYLPDGKNGSWIIISTQQSEVARLCVGDPWQMFELKQNSAEHSVCVFFQEGPQGDDRYRSKKTKLQGGLGDLTKLLLTKKPGGDLGVMSLWAAGGNADTTPVVREAYGEPEICENFVCRGWAKLMHPFNPLEFQRSLLIQFHKNSCLQKKLSVDVDTLNRLEALPEDKLIQELKKKMKGRYLVVLENISTVVDWNTVRAYLPDRKNNSWIIISTTQSEIARLFVGDPWQALEHKQFSAEYSGPQGNDRDKNKQITMVIPNHNEASSSTNEVRYKGGYALYASIPTSKNNADMWMDRFPLVGVRKSQMEDLRGYIANARMKGFAVVSVWGIAGVGKSALVRNLYYDTMCSGNRMFTMYGWVDVSHPFNLAIFAWSLLSELQSDSPEQNGITNPIQECRQLLENHRCLVVIDGLESTEEWDLIRHSLVSTHPRSTIIVITTEASIGTHCCANREEAMYNVKSLEDDEARDLFKKEVRIFPDPYALRNSEGPELRKLISKCGGLPKLIVAVADFLAPMSVSLMNSAVSLSDRFMHDMETKPEFDNLRGLFGWMHSYFRTCPYYLKPCILYLSIFPQGQSIRRRRLVRRWIAEGYSRGTSSQSAEENGEKFFLMLLDLSIVQQAPHSVTTADTRMVLCKVNGFFREYIISRRKDEELVFELEGRCTLTSQRTGRHLVIKDSWNRDKIVFSSIDFSRLRSLTVFGEWKPFFINETMRVLRVLDLENATGVTYKYLGQMLKVLPRLKFLSLRGRREICCLPSSFAGLRQLETLDVRGTSIATLPPSITKLTKLQYIRAGTAKEASVPCSHLSWLPCCCRGCPVGGVEVPAGIEKLTALHTLGAVNVGFSGGKAILKELKKLTQLHKLEVTGVNKRNSNEFCSAISDHVHLESLSVWLSMGNNQHFSEDMFSTQENPLEKLQSLKLYGPLRSVPAWIKDLSKLTKLKLEVTMSVQDEVNNVLRVLGEIKELRILRLCAKPLQDGDGNLDFRVSVAGVHDRCYRKVKILEISCSSNLTVTFGSHAMENLELLIGTCCIGSALKFAELKNLSVGKLKEVRYLGSLDEHKAGMENQLNEHPMKPALNHVRPDGH